MASPSDDPARERRVAVRVTSQQQAPCYFATLERITARWADIVDVSAAGIGLLFDVPLEPNTQIQIELPTKDPVDAQALPARVLRCEPSPGGKWVLGCAFAQALTVKQLETLV